MPFNKLIAVCLITGAGLLAQTQTPAPPKYEVASIKLNQSGALHTISASPGGRLVTTNATLKALIGFAYNLREYQISGGPNWLDVTGYDILATPEHPFTPALENIDTSRQMIQGLLSDRFKLTTHFESKDLPVYALVPAKDGRKLKDAGPPQSPGDVSLRGGGVGLITAQHITMPFVVQHLSDRLGRLVLDKTGLTGHYDFKLEWTPDETEANGGPLPADHTGPSLYTAIQEQLGLKLEPQKAPVKILIIDRAEKASEN